MQALVFEGHTPWGVARCPSCHVHWAVTAHSGTAQARQTRRVEQPCQPLGRRPQHQITATGGFVWFKCLDADCALPFQHLKIFAKFHFCTCAHLLVPVRKSRSWVQTTTSNKPRIQRHTRSQRLAVTSTYPPSCTLRRMRITVHNRAARLFCFKPQINADSLISALSSKTPSCSPNLFGDLEPQHDLQICVLFCRTLKTGNGQIYCHLELSSATCPWVSILRLPQRPEVRSDLAGLNCVRENAEVKTNEPRLSIEIRTVRTLKSRTKLPATELSSQTGFPSILLHAPKTEPINQSTPLTSKHKEWAWPSCSLLYLRHARNNTRTNARRTALIEGPFNRYDAANPSPSFLNQRLQKVWKFHEWGQLKPKVQSQQSITHSENKVESHVLVILPGAITVYIWYHIQRS